MKRILQQSKSRRLDKTDCSVETLKELQTRLYMQIHSTPELMMEEDDDEKSDKDSSYQDPDVIRNIRAVGEILIQTDQQQQQQQIRSDPVFEHFCDSCMLQFLVDIAKQKPDQIHATQVAWSPCVKAQVFSTVSALVVHARDTALYYLLSKNSVNQLLLCLLPLSQWTHPTLQIMLPSYVELLKQLTLQLTSSPALFPLFVYENTLSLFQATLEVANYAYLQSDSYVHAMCLNLLVDLLHIEPVHVWFIDSTSSSSSSDLLSRLVRHVCQILLDRYERLVTLTTGPIVNTARNATIHDQLAAFQDHVDLLNDLFWCQVKPFSMKLCEALLQRFVAVLLQDLSDDDRSLLVVGLSDTDVIPQAEAKAQVATLVLTKLLGLEYAPLVRMLAVAVWHGKSTTLWKQPNEEPYCMTCALHAVVQGSGDCDNGYRAEILKALRGDYGEYRFVPTAMLLETTLGHAALDAATLQLLELIPKDGNGDDVDDGNERELIATPIESALTSFLRTEHKLHSMVSYMALDCASSLVTRLVCKSHTAGNFKQNRVFRALVATRDYFYSKTIESQKVIGASDIFVDLIESAVKEMYKRTTLPLGSASSGHSIYAFVMVHHGCPSFANDPGILVRKMHGVNQTDEIEVTRFYARMALVCRARCRLLERYDKQIQAKARAPPTLQLYDPAERLSEIFGCIRSKPETGSDLDLRGRMVFRFSSVVSGHTLAQGSNRERSLSQDMIHLILVLDPTDMFVVRPVKRNDSRGTVVCGVPLVHVIAAASDDECLHVAVRHHDVGFLIKNGNMALRFESTGTCLIVKQYLDRCRQVLRREVLDKILALFETTAAAATTTTVKDEGVKS